MRQQHTDKKRATRLVVTVILVLCLLVVGVYFVAQKGQTGFVAKKPTQAGQAEAQKIGLAGDDTLTAQYIDAIHRHDAAGAQHVFDTSIKNTSDTKAKLDLISQNVSVALEYKQTDAALKAALLGVSIEPSSATYTDAYMAYYALDNLPKQREMLQKAIASETASSDPSKEQVVAGLNNQLQGVNARIALKDKGVK